MVELEDIADDLDEAQEGEGGAKPAGERQRLDPARRRATPPPDRRGLGGEETDRHAKAVVERAAPTVVEAMGCGEASTGAAAGR